MHVLRSTFVTAVCLLVTLVHAAGLRFISVPAEAPSPIHAVIWSPCLEQAGEVRLGTITLPATENCVVAGEKLPLIVISHGYGAFFASHHDTAEVLADGGFVVVALSHPADAGDGVMSRADSLTVLTERPADIKRVIDYMLSAWPDRAKLDPENIGLFGFSRGGYTVLVVAGGNPDIRRFAAFCPKGSLKYSCAQLEKNDLPTEAFVHDDRVKAAVIADPAFSPLFDRDGLKDVKIPIQLWASELSGEDRTGGEITRDYVSAIDRDLPVKPEYHLVPGAGHFAFTLPCRPESAKKFPTPCADGPGFDRATFHKEFNTAVLSFFRKHLGRN
jgi:predicted dienelactone hydrolase